MSDYLTPPPPPSEILNTPQPQPLPQPTTFYQPQPISENRNLSSSNLSSSNLSSNLSSSNYFYDNLKYFGFGLIVVALIIALVLIIVYVIVPSTKDGMAVSPGCVSCKDKLDGDTPAEVRPFYAPVKDVEDKYPNLTPACSLPAAPMILSEDWSNLLVDQVADARMKENQMSWFSDLNGKYGGPVYVDSLDETLESSIATTGLRLRSSAVPNRGIMPFLNEIDSSQLGNSGSTDPLYHMLSIK